MNSAPSWFHLREKTYNFGRENKREETRDVGINGREIIKKTSSFKRADCSNELTWQRMGTQNEWEGPREGVRPWGSRVGSAVHCSGVTSDNGPAVNGPAVTSRNCVLDPRKNETLDVVTSKRTFRETEFGVWTVFNYILSSIPSLTPTPTKWTIFIHYTSI